MTEKENYPGKWQGSVPEELKMVAHGKAAMDINLDVCLEHMEHLTFPVYKALEGLKVLDPACGTGEVLLIMAAKYQQVSFEAYDSCAAALVQAQQYAEELELKNICFLSSLPEEHNYDFIWVTRPLQQIDNLTEFLKKLNKNLAEEGIMRIRSFTGSHPADNLYLQETVAEMKAGQLNNEETHNLIKELLAQPLQEHIDGLRECNQILDSNGFRFQSGLHPRSYEPASYLQTNAGQLFTGLALVDKAYLAEQFCGKMLMHSLLYTHRSYNPEMPSFYDPQASKYIPHLSAYAGVSQQDERMIVSLKQHHLMLEEGIEIEDLSLPEDLYRILPKLDGKINFEQIHRQFLPLPWERFWTLMQACWEEEIIYLHRPTGRNKD